MLFDMDGTMCDTDPIHMEVFSELLLAHGKCGGVRIDDAFFREKIAGRTNEDIFGDLPTSRDLTSLSIDEEALETGGVGGGGER